jgi:sec-independent protein translocase protein TatB
MFDITSSKLLILGIVALLVIGPKDLPALLRTIGKYMGIVKRHAAEFRAQFDEAMRESELAELKKDVEKMGAEAEATVRAAELSVDKEVAAAQQDVDRLMTADAKPADAVAHDANDLPLPPPAKAVAQPASLNGAAHPHDTAAAPTETAAADAGSTPAKTGT